MVNEDTTGWMVNALYTMAAAADVLLTDIGLQLRTHGRKFNHQAKACISYYLKSVKESCVWYEKSVEYETDKAIKGEYSKLDSQRADANETVRLMLLYYDRSRTQENYEAIFKFLRSLPSSGIFSEEDIARFNFKTKE